MTVDDKYWAIISEFTMTNDEEKISVNFVHVCRVHACMHVDYQQGR